MNTYLSLLAERKLKEAEALRRQSIPRKLIKFFSLSDNLEKNEKKFNTLANEQLWFSSISSLNDPYEFSCMYIDDEKLRGKGYPDKVIQGFEQLIGDTLRNFGVVSLSDNSPDFFPMWAYYANNYSGYCVEYEVILPDAVHQISYEPNRIALASVPANFYSEFQKMQERGEETNKEVEFYATIIMQQLFMKHKSWSHEKEYRVVYPIGTKDGLNVSIANVGLKTCRIIAGINCNKRNLERLQEISNTLGCGTVETPHISSTSYALL